MGLRQKPYRTGKGFTTLTDPFSPDPDHALIVLARDVLAAAGFTVTTLRLHEIDVAVVAVENAYSLAAILAGDDWSHIRPWIGPVDVAFSNWAVQQEPTGKRWDLYLICLTQEGLSSPAQYAQAERFEADTRRVRKFVRDGVLPERLDVERALSPLLPLEFGTGPVVADPLRALEAKLRTRGVSAEAATTAVQAFIETGEVRLTT